MFLITMIMRLRVSVPNLSVKLDKSEADKAERENVVGWQQSRCYIMFPVASVDDVIIRLMIMVWWT